jgi:septation ring formation regulator EzrA
MVGGKLTIDRLRKFVDTVSSFYKNKFCRNKIDMSETKGQLELAGLERFGQLEDKLFRMVEEFRVVRKDNESLRAENAQLKEQLGALRNNESAAQDNLTKYQKEREELRERVEKALNLLSTLEAH